MSEFTDWLNEELSQRDWTYRELARRSKKTHAAISHVMNETRQPGTELCIAIARAFRLPPETVYRKAGLLPPLPDRDENTERILYYYDQMTDHDQERFLKLAETFAAWGNEEEEQQRANTMGTTTQAQSASPAS